MPVLTGARKTSIKYCIAQSSGLEDLESSSNNSVYAQNLNSSVTTAQRHHCTDQISSVSKGQTRRSVMLQMSSLLEPHP